MIQQIFINLPIKELARSTRFFGALGFSFNPQFTNEKATCMIISEEAFVMLLVEPFFKGFTPRPIADATKTTEVLLCLSADSRDAVDGQVDKAVAAGGKADPTPTQDFGFMYGRSFEDPDGHIWEVMWMDPTAIPAGEPAEATA